MAIAVAAKRVLVATQPVVLSQPASGRSKLPRGTKTTTRDFFFCGPVPMGNSQRTESSNTRGCVGRCQLGKGLPFPAMLRYCRSGIGPDRRPREVEGALLARDRTWPPPLPMVESAGSTASQGSDLTATSRARETESIRQPGIGPGCCLRAMAKSPRMFMERRGKETESLGYLLRWVAGRQGSSILYYCSE